MSLILVKCWLIIRLIDAQNCADKCTIWGAGKEAREWHDHANQIQYAIDEINRCVTVK